MATIPVRIHGRDYQLACDAGQEEQLALLAAEVDDRVRGLSRQIPHASEAMLLLLSAIMLADELSDTRRNVRVLQSQVNRLSEQDISPSADDGQAEIHAEMQAEIEAERQRLAEERAQLSQVESAMAATLHEVAARIEKIAGELEIS